MGAYIINGSIINGLGDTPVSVSQAVRSGISSVQISNHWNSEFNGIKASLLPLAVLPCCENVDLSNLSPLQKQLFKISAALINDDIRSYFKEKGVLFLSGPEKIIASVNNGLGQDVFELLNGALEIDIDLKQSRYFEKGGRAGFFLALKAGIEMLENNQSISNIVVGGVDSPKDHALLAFLDYQGRLLAESKLSGYCPGEGGAMVVLSRTPAKFVGSQKQVKVSVPHIGEEPGGIHSSKPCLGDGLSTAVKSAFQAIGNDVPIVSIYSSMNGEHYWSKELGTIMIRFSRYFNPNTSINHPADCWGDIGAAYGPSVINMMPFINSGRHLVYGSSEFSMRAACLVDVE